MWCETSIETSEPALEVYEDYLIAARVRTMKDMDLGRSYRPRDVTSRATPDT